MSMKEEYTAIDMSTAAADGFRDGQRAANGHSAQSIGMVGALVTALDGLLSITQDSTGVAGYHLNGNVAEWDEFPEVGTARDVLNLCRERSAKPPTAAEWVPVAERLPSAEQGTVAVLTDDGAILTAWASYWSGARTDFACWTFPHGDDDDSVVTHWMPLPAPPKQIKEQGHE